ncbi:MAG: RNA 2',3'-cyclic phosphodiesterase [Thermoanaerobaculia bacterium]
MRLFVAYRIGTEPAARVASVVSSVCARLPRSAWVGRDAYHLTFAFLGEHDVAVVPLVASAMKSATSALSAVDARLAGGGFFPTERRPRVGWVEVEPSEPVVAIADAVRAELAERGVGFDGKAFKAHLTLVRIREAWTESDVGLFREAVSAAGAIPFRLDRVSLFESQLRPAGAVHTELAHCDLG